MDNEDPIAAQFTWENGTPQQQMSQYIDPNAVDPGLIEMGPQPGPAQPPQPGLQSASVETRGMTQHGLKMASGLYGNAEAQAQNDMAGYNASQAPLEQHLGQDYASLEKSAADQGQAEREHYDRTVELMGRQSEFLNHSADVMQQINARGDQVKAQYLGDYEEQLAGVRALAAASGNPLSGMGGGQAAGMAMANFAQGWLATRGIHIDVSGQIDRWINRSLQEHQQQVENARGSAQDTLHLYDIARQTSNDQSEALLKYRGMVIEGFKSATEMEAAKFGSQVASAKAQERIAQLDTELTKTKIDLGDKARAAYVQYHTMRFTEAHQMGQLAIEQEKLALAKAKQKADNSQKAGDMYISDPEYVRGKDGKELTDGSGNRIVVNRWKLKGDLPQSVIMAAAKDGNDARKNFADTTDALDTMMTSYESAKRIKEKLGGGGAGKVLPAKMSWDVAARMDDTGTVSKFLQDRQKYVLATLKNDSGKAFSENEVEVHNELAALDKTLQQGTRGDVLYHNLAEGNRKVFERNMQGAYFEKTDPKDPKYYDTAAPASPQHRAANAINDPTNPDTNAPAVHTAVAAETAKAGELANPKGDTLDEALTPREPTKASGLWQKMMNGDKQPPNTANIDHLALAAVNPAAFRNQMKDEGEIPEDDEQLRNDALAGLERITKYHDRDTALYAMRVEALARHAAPQLKSLLEE